MTTELHEKIGRQRAALMMAHEGIKEIQKGEPDEATAKVLETMVFAVEKGLEEDNDFEPFGYHVRGLLNCFMREGQKTGDELIDLLEKTFSECRQWGLVSALEERACTRLGRYPVEGNYLIDMRDQISEILQYLPSVEGGDGEVNRWIEEAAVKLYAAIHISLPKELKHISMDEWVHGDDKEDIDTSDNDGAESAQPAENSHERTQDGAGAQ